MHYVSTVTITASIPRRNPHTTCAKVCCLNIIRLDPTSPPSSITNVSHQMGLKLKINAKAMTPPVTPPIAAVWVEIFHHTLTSAHNICTTNAATSIEVMICGTL